MNYLNGINPRYLNDKLFGKQFVLVKYLLISNNSDHYLLYQDIEDLEMYKMEKLFELTRVNIEHDEYVYVVNVEKSLEKDYLTNLFVEQNDTKVYAEIRLMLNYSIDLIDY